MAVGSLQEGPQPWSTDTIKFRNVLLKKTTDVRATEKTWSNNIFISHDTSRPVFRSIIIYDALEQRQPSLKVLFL